MNLLDKKWLGLTLFALAPVFFSCDDENQIGKEINPGEDRIKIAYQEFTLPTQNIFFDSVRTDSDPYVLVGKYQNDIVGTTIAEGYAKYGSSSASSPDSLAVLDSVVLSLTIDKFHGTFPKSQTIIVKEVQDSIFGSLVYTSDKKATLIDTEIGRLTKVFDPSSDTAIHIELSLAFGAPLFERLKNEEITAVTDPNELRPIALIPGDEDGILLALDPEDANSVMSFHYNDSMVFNLQFASQAGYNNIRADRSTGLLSSLSDEKFQRFDVDPDRVFMHPATGIFPIVDLDPVYDFFAGRDSINIIAAQLAAPLDPSDTSAYLRTSETIRYYFGNPEGRYNGSGLFTDPASTLVLASQTYVGQAFEVATGLIDTVDYAFKKDITQFTQLFIKEQIDRDIDGQFPFSLVLIPNTASAVDQTVFFKNDMKLRIHYTVPN